MASDAVSSLVAIGSSPLGGPLTHQAGGLEPLLRQKNGFVAFEGALVVFPTGNTTAYPESLESWNDTHRWRSGYEHLMPAGTCFAEDAFGNQFVLNVDGSVGFFDAETANSETIASSIEEWARVVLADWDYFTGHSVAIAWQAKHGVLSSTDRLLPVKPFCLGGEFLSWNLRAIERGAGMKWRGSLALQLESLSEGAQVELKVID